MNKLTTYFALFLIACVFHGCDKSTIEIKKIKVDEGELAYYTRGEGDPLILITGFRSTMVAWDPAFLELLEKHFQLIIFDNRGIGLSSDNLEKNLTIQQMAEDTAKVIQELGFEKAHVLGWSMGSRIAMELAIKYPELVNTLILCSPNPGGIHQAPRPSDAYRKLNSDNISRSELLSLLFPDSEEGREALKQYVSRLAKSMISGKVPNDMNMDLPAIMRQSNAMKLWDGNNRIYERLASIQSPTLVAGGKNDALDSPLNVKIVAERIPFAWTAYFPLAGHNFISQNYNEFANLIILFIHSNKDRT